MMEYNGLNGKYTIYGLKSDSHPNGMPIAQTDTGKLFVAQFPSGQFGYMKIARHSSQNKTILREAAILRDLQLEANLIDAGSESKGLTKPNYGAFFPKVIELFDAADRKVMFLGFHPSITSYQQFLPFSFILENQRIDLKTANWILGKFYKILGFVHEFGYSLGLILPSNILLETEIHGVFILDFSEAQKTIDPTVFAKEISRAAKIIWLASGGQGSQKPPHDPEIMSSENHFFYTTFLSDLINNPPDNANFVFEQLYQLADSIWPKVPKEDGTPGLKRQFHHFCTYPK